MQFNKSRGLNLIELMIVVAIIGVIAGIAYPNYISSVRKAKLADAKDALGELASALTRAHTTSVPRTYSGHTVGATPSKPLASFFPDTVPLDGSVVNYDLTIQEATATSFTVRATAASGANVDPDCTPLELSSNGTRTPAGCW